MEGRTLTRYHKAYKLDTSNERSLTAWSFSRLQSSHKVLPLLVFPRLTGDFLEITTMVIKCLLMSFEFILVFIDNPRCFSSSETEFDFTSTARGPIKSCGCSQETQPYRIAVSH